MAAAAVVDRVTTLRIRALPLVRRMQRLRELVVLVAEVQVVNARMRPHRELRTPVVVAVVVDTHTDSVIRMPLVVAVARESSSCVTRFPSFRLPTLRLRRTMERRAPTT